MSGIVWSKWFWSDWQSDPALRLCSYAARGLWMDMLCIAAAHDPIGFVCVSDRALDSTSLARMTGGTESEVALLIAELDRNGVFSRDRHGRVYSRRMVEDAKRAKIARENGALGGNPNLRKRKGNPPPDNPNGDGEVKPHKPEARRKVEPPKGSNLSFGRGAPTSEPDGSSSPLAWTGPEDIREIVVAKMGEDYAKSWLDPCAWQDVPERLIVARGGMAADRLWRDFRKEFSEREISVGRKAA